MFKVRNLPVAMLAVVVFAFGLAACGETKQQQTSKMVALMEFQMFRNATTATQAHHSRGNMMKALSDGGLTLDSIKATTEELDGKERRLYSEERIATQNRLLKSSEDCGQLMVDLKAFPELFRGETGRDIPQTLLNVAKRRYDRICESEQK